MLRAHSNLAVCLVACALALMPCGCTDALPAAGEGTSPPLPGAIPIADASAPADESSADTPTLTTATTTATSATTTDASITSMDTEPTTKDDSVSPDATLSPGRVRSGLIALYTFADGAGSTVSDVSGVAPALDLEGVSGNVDWIGSRNGIRIGGSSFVGTTGPATKIIDRAQASGAFTVEAWVQLASATPSSTTLPDRIVTLSSTDSLRNFTLGQGNNLDLEARLRTSTGDSNGRPILNAPGVLSVAGEHHIVMTWDTGTGEMGVYLDGARVLGDMRGGDLSTWDASHRFGVGNEPPLNRPWLGQVYLVAVYERALTGLEIRQNQRAGSNTR